MGQSRSQKFLTIVVPGLLLLTTSSCSSPETIWVGTNDQYLVAEVIRDVVQAQGYRIQGWDRESTVLDFGAREDITEDEKIAWRPRIEMSPGAGGWIVHVYVWKQESEMERGVVVETEEGERDEDMEERLRRNLIGEFQTRGIDATVGAE